MRLQIWSGTLLGGALLLLSNSLAWGKPPNSELFQCDEPNGVLCAEQRSNPGGKGITSVTTSLRCSSTRTSLARVTTRSIG